MKYLLFELAGKWTHEQTSSFECRSFEKAFGSTSLQNSSISWQVFFAFSLDLLPFNLYLDNELIKAKVGNYNIYRIYSVLITYKLWKICELFKYVIIKTALNHLQLIILGILFSTLLTFMQNTKYDHQFLSDLILLNGTFFSNEIKCVLRLQYPSNGMEISCTLDS